MRWNHLAALKLKAFLGASSESRAYPVIWGQERLSLFSPWQSKFHLSFQALSRSYRFPVTQISLGFPSYDVWWYRFDGHVSLPQKPLKGISSPSTTRTVWAGLLSCGTSCLLLPDTQVSSQLGEPRFCTRLGLSTLTSWPHLFLLSCFRGCTFTD